ncbi:MAG: hypothetical protein QOI25_3787 [Mycobacterium sp.]|nr:hypothetical protein [Mycobacterium sp.]
MKGWITTGNGAPGIGRLEQATQESRDTEHTGDRGLAGRNPATAVGDADRAVGEQPDQWLGVAAEGRGEKFLDDLPRDDRIDLGTDPHWATVAP